MKTDQVQIIIKPVKNMQHARFHQCGLVVALVLAFIVAGCADQTGAQSAQTRTATPQVIKTTVSQATQQVKAVVATAAATTKPTLQPTLKPTLTPTVKPTVLVPTKSKPTLTAEPSITPTDEPTLEPTAVPEPSATREIIRPFTHLIKETGVQDAAGELVINNNSEYDGLAILATFDSPNSPIASGVIRNGESLTIGQVPDGVYRLYFCTGTEWVPELNQFASVISYQSFEDAFEYTTSSDEYTSWEVTLAPVADGNARSVPVSPGDFPAAN